MERDLSYFRSQLTTVILAFASTRTSNSEKRWLREIRRGQFPRGRPHKLLIFLRRRRGRNAHDGVIAIGGCNRAGIAVRPLGRLARLDRSDALPQLLAEHDDATIGGPEMLEAVNRDRPLTDLSLVVARSSLAHLVGLRRKLTGKHDIAIRPPIGCGALGLTHMPELDEHRVGIVDGNDPPTHHGAAERVLDVTVFPDRGDLLKIR